VEHDPDQVTKDELITAIEQVGYKAKASAF
jgi:hypothetical protein